MTRRQRWYRLRNCSRDAVATVVALGAILIMVLMIVRSNAMLGAPPPHQDRLVPLTFQKYMMEPIGDVLQCAGDQKPRASEDMVWCSP